MTCKIAVVGIGGWYPRGVARLIQRFNAYSPGFDISAWINCLPPGAPERVVDNDYDYTGYCAKPFALRALADQGADIGILMDAAFYPIRHIQPLVDFITGNDYYFCKNGFKAGEWASDRALQSFGVSRDEAMQIEEISSYCVGLRFGTKKTDDLLEEWCRRAEDGHSFPGPHTNAGHASGRNAGFCSADPRCKGHRHDQTSLSLIAWGLTMDNLIERPRFTAYKAGYGGFSDETTVLENEGGI